MSLKFRNIIKDYLSFNKSEQRGIFIMLLLMTGLLVTDMVLQGREPDRQADISGFSSEIDAFNRELAIADSLEILEKQLRRAGDFKSGKGDSLFSTDRQTPYKKEDPWTVDLNRADTLDLQRLRGIGPAFARRIVKYRDRLGGFTTPSQLLEVFGMDAGKLEMIRDHVMVGEYPVRQIDLNTVTFKEMMAHPYFPYEITRNLMIYRKEHKRFSSVEELLQVKFINDSVFGRIKPYVRVD